MQLSKRSSEPGGGGGGAGIVSCRSLGESSSNGSPPRRLEGEGRGTVCRDSPELTEGSKSRARINAQNL